MAFLFLAAACGGESTPTATPAPVLSDVLTNAGEKMAAMSSAKFSMVDEKESGAKFFETTFKSLEAEVKAPDSFRMLVEVVSPAFGFVEIEMMAVGEQALMKFSKDAPWAPLPLDQVAEHFLRQLRIAGQLYDDDGPETTRLVTIDGINVPVEIELPDLGSGP